MPRSKSLTPEVEMAHPLKQGLKQLPYCLYMIGVYVEMAHPLKQGLKPCIASIYNAWPQVEMAHPLKQGLKLVTR